MRRSEGTTDLLQEFSIIGHDSHHSREEHHIKATLLLGRSRVRSAALRTFPSPPFGGEGEGEGGAVIGGLPGRSFNRGGKAEVKAGINAPKVTNASEDSCGWA